VLESHEFLDTAERNGRMPAIDRWVIRALLVWMQRNRERWADANAVFSVNLSGRSVVRPDFRDYLEQTEKAIDIQTRPKLFRPPGGVAWPRQLRVARSRGYMCVLGSAYANDPIHPPVWYIRGWIEKNLLPGAIVILHDGISDPTRSIQALPHILAAGRQKGLRFISVGALMRSAVDQLDRATISDAL